MRKGVFIMEFLEILITGIFTMGLLAIYAVVGFVAVMMVQLISYRVFKFNIYKKIVRLMEA